MTSRPNGQQPYHNGLIHQAGKKKRTSDDLPEFIGDFVPVLDQTTYPKYPRSLKRRRLSYREQPWRQLLQSGIHFRKRLTLWKPQELLWIPLVLIITWGIVLWMGEKAVFRRKVEECAWNRWENWVRPCSCCPDGLIYHHDLPILTIFVARRIGSAPRRPRRGSSTGGSPYVSWTTVASLIAHGPLH